MTAMKIARQEDLERYMMIGKGGVLVGKSHADRR